MLSQEGWRQGVCNFVANDFGLFGDFQFSPTANSQRETKPK